MTETINGPRRRTGRAVALALGLGLAIAAQAGPAGAEGAQTFHYGFKGETAEARFYSSDGCVGTEAFVHAVDGRVKFGGGRPDTQSTVFVAVTRVDICTQQPLGFSIGFRENLGDALQIDRLDGAVLTTTVEMTDMATAASSTMAVRLQWTGIGEPLKAREHIMLDYPGFRVNARGIGTTRAADVGGVLSDGTVDYSSGAWASGSLSSVQAGEVDVLH
jgi:hypothetical protein